MAQRHLDPTGPAAGPVPADALAGYLRAQATEFLRALRHHRETGAGAAGPEGSAEAARALRRAARRISASLHTFQPVLDPDWSEAMRPELAWVSGTLALEHAYASRLERLLLALHRLSGATAFPSRGPGPAALGGAASRTPASTAGRAPDTVGATAGTAGAAVAVTAAPAGTARGTAGRAPSGTGGAPGPDAPDGRPGSAPAPAHRTTGTASAARPGADTATRESPDTAGAPTDPAPAAAEAPGRPAARPAHASRTGTAAPSGTARVPADPDAPPAGRPATRTAHASRTAVDGTAGAARAGTGVSAAAHRTAGAPTVTATVPAPDRGNLTVGAAKAGALLDRQLTLARTRAHSTALQALGSSRFHGIADRVAVLASEVPLSPAAAGADLRPLAEAAHERLTDAVAALPLLTAGSPYNAEALIHGLSPDPAPHPQDAPWHQVRLLLRLHRYAREVLHAGDGVDAPADVRLLTAGEALDRHRDASEAAAAAAQAARTPRIAPATAYALGVLHADQRHEVEAARYAFQHSWQKDVVGTS